MENIEMHVVPLFSSPLGIMGIKEELSNLQKSINNYEFVPTNYEQPTNCYITQNVHILNDFPEEKNIFLKYFYMFKNDVLKLETTEFEITTSWITKTSPKGFSKSHRHMNSVYSGVFYFEDIQDANIEFESFGIFSESIRVNEATEWNIFNSKIWKVNSEKNKLIFFPSYLYHNIGVNNSDKERYSLAFNLFPTGSLTHRDSSIEFRL